MVSYFSMIGLSLTPESRFDVLILLQGLSRIFSCTAA